jgi:predicted phage tail protein
MTVQQAPHPLDVNFHSCTLNSSEAGWFHALVGAVLLVMFLVYSALAVLLAASGGEEGGGANEEASFFVQLYEGVIQSALLALLLALLPLFMHLLGRLSRFKQRHEVCAT